MKLTNHFSMKILGSGFCSFKARNSGHLYGDNKLFYVYVFVLKKSLFGFMFPLCSRAMSVMEEFKDRIAELKKLLPLCLLRDETLIRRNLKQRMRPDAFAKKIEGWEKRALSSAEIVEKRAVNKPAIDYPKDLPVSQEAERICTAIPRKSGCDCLRRYGFRQNYAVTENALRSRLRNPRPNWLHSAASFGGDGDGASRFRRTERIFRKTGRLSGSLF